MYWLWYILIGLAAGYVASLIVKGSGSGMLLNLVIGMVGGVLGGWLFRLMGIASTNMLGSLLTSVFGAIVLLLIVGLFTRRKRECTLRIRAIRPLCAASEFLYNLKNA